MVVDDYVNARNGLLAKDLIAFDGSRFQVLSLPSKPVYAAPHAFGTGGGFTDHDAASVRSTILSSLAEQRRR
jgi:hypothetical protein